MSFVNRDRGLVRDSVADSCDNKDGPNREVRATQPGPDPASLDYTEEQG